MLTRITDSKLPDWKAIDLNSTLKRAIFTLDFLKPTDIQARSLPSALQGRDIVGVAETVSTPTHQDIRGRRDPD